MDEIRKCIHEHEAHTKKKYQFQYQDYEKRHLRWKHDAQNGIHYAEPCQPSMEKLEERHTITLTLSLLKSILVAINE